METKNIIGEVAVEVKTGLSVDKRTAQICMDLLSIHFKNEGVKGVVMRFNDDPQLGGIAVTPLLTEEEVNAAMFAKFHCNERNRGD